MEPLTEKQKRVMEFIEQEVKRWNYPPSVREICKALKISSTATVHGHLDTLESKGYISRMATKPRAIKLIKNADGEVVADPEERCVFAPLVGRITAGQPILAEENKEGLFPIPSAISNDENCFILRVAGDSMIGAGINDGDYVVVRQQSNAENGEIAAVLLEDEATVKRVYIEENGYRLQPENDAFEPIVVRNAEILGKVIGLFRRI